MKRIVLLVSPAIILTLVMLVRVPAAHAQTYSPPEISSGQGITTPCTFTMTWTGTYCDGTPDGSWSSTHSGLGGTGTWTSAKNPWSSESCADVYSVTLSPGDRITITSSGDFPYNAWEGNGEDPKYPAFWCHSINNFSIVSGTVTSGQGVYVADAYDNGVMTCYVGYGTGYGGRDHDHHSPTYAWSWTVDSPCVEPEVCGGVQDAHMVLDPPASPWIPIPIGGGFHSGSEWNLVSNLAPAIRQTIVLTEGVYDISVIARTVSLDGNPTLQVQLGTNVANVRLLSTSLSRYDVIVLSDGGSQNLLLSVNTGANIFIDHICINPGMTCALPCSMGESDVSISRQYLKNSEMYGLEYPPGLWSVNCSAGVSLPGGVGLACGTHREDTGLNAYNWSGSGVNSDVSGVKRWSGAGICGQAVGLMPPPLQNGTTQVLNMRPDGPYNVALRMKRVYGNSRLTVCGQTIDFTELGEWVDASFYCPDGRNSVSLLADCTGGSCVSHYQGSDIGDYAAIEVDDVYIIPGGQISCTTQTVVPTMNCINNNYHLVGLSSRTEMQGAAPQTTLEEGWNLSNARMGSLAAGPYAHQARLWPSNGDTFVSQYVPAQTGSVADGDYIVPGRSYSITVSSSRFDNTDATLDVVVGAQSAGAQTWNIDMSGANASTIWSQGFVASADMLNGDNVAVRVGNTGGSVLVDNVCISTGGPPITPTNQCIGTWASSSGGNPYGGMTPVGDYIKNTVDLAGNYRLDMAGVIDSNGAINVKYYMPSTGEEIDISSVFVMAGAFSTTVTFPVPQTGFASGELRIYPLQNVTFNEVCLSPYDAPGGNGPGLPGPAPIPECGTVTSRIRTPIFYMMSPYSITTEYTETAPAYYAAELTYNYAIYPLVCTTISVANWQYDAYNQFKVAFDKMVAEFRNYFLAIIDVLWAIYDKIGQGGGGGFDLLGLLWQLFMMLIKLLLKLLALVYQVMDLLLTTLKSVSLNSKSEQAQAYPMTCVGDAQWICFGLAAILAADNMAGQWMRLVAYLAVGCMTIGLIFWLSGQVRKLLQPEDSSTVG